ncbi:MAG: ion transporter [Acidobacteriota bacterium]|nr:ion transporter [Acidobacteriota bacterium]
MTLKEIVEEGKGIPGRIFDMTVQVLILVSLLAFSMETLPNLTEQEENILELVEIITVLLFTGEYLLRLYVADSKPRFIFSFFGLVDLIAILPFYLAIGLDLRSVRVCRIFRLFRVLKLVRYSSALTRYRRAFQSIGAELFLFFLATGILLFLAAVGIYHFEGKAQPETFGSVFHSLWWAVITLTTVGYGDAYPVTMGGRFFTFVILMLGLGIVALPSGLMASALNRAAVGEEREET